jgi:hypothetical protein
VDGVAASGGKLYATMTGAHQQYDTWSCTNQPADCAAVVAAAKAQADILVAEAQKLRSEADAHKLVSYQEAEEAAQATRAAAEKEGDHARARAREDARLIVREAREAASLVLREGNELSGNLRDLGASLQRNASRLLGDVKLAHAALTADLDQAAPGGAAGPFVRDARPSAERATPRERGDARADRATIADAELDVPEFIPRRR